MMIYIIETPSLHLPIILKIVGLKINKGVMKNEASMSHLT